VEWGGRIGRQGGCSGGECGMWVRVVGEGVRGERGWGECGVSLILAAAIHERMMTQLPLFIHTLTGTCHRLHACKLNCTSLRTFLSHSFHTPHFALTSRGNGTISRRSTLPRHATDETPWNSATNTGLSGQRKRRPLPALLRVPAPLSHLTCLPAYDPVLP